MSRELSRFIAPLVRRVRLMAARAVIKLIDDASKLQGAQVGLLDGEVRDAVERFQQYGFTSVPLPGAEGVYLSLNGCRDNGVLVCVDDRRYRPAGLQAGEAALYTDEDKDAGEHRIHFKRGKEISIIAGASRIDMTPAGITVTTPAFDLVKS